MGMSSMGVTISAEPHWIDAAGALAEKMGAYLGLPAPEAGQAGEAVIAAATIILSPEWNGTPATDLEMVFQEGPRGVELSLRYAGGPSPEQLRQAFATLPAGATAALQAMDAVEVEVEVENDRDVRVCHLSRRLPLP